MNFAPCVLYRMVDHFMLKFIKALVRFQGIRENRGTNKHMLTNLGLKSLFLRVIDNLGADLAATLQDSHNGGLVSSASCGDAPRAFGGVHVARFPADESFVCFDLAGQFVLLMVPIPRA